MEYEFYLFARQQFEAIKRRAFRLKDNFLVEKEQQFTFEKIRPRWSILVFFYVVFRDAHMSTLCLNAEWFVFFVL